MIFIEMEWNYRRYQSYAYHYRSVIGREKKMYALQFSRYEVVVIYTYMYKETEDDGFPIYIHVMQEFSMLLIIEADNRLSRIRIRNVLFFWSTRSVTIIHQFKSVHSLCMRLYIKIKIYRWLELMLKKLNKNIIDQVIFVNHSSEQTVRNLTTDWQQIFIQISEISIVCVRN